MGIERELLEYYQRAPLLELGAAAHSARMTLHPDPVVTYIVDRNINYTNVCVADCGFCAFYRRPKDGEGWTLSYEQIGKKIDEVKALGGVQILIQGGHNPYIPFEWYLELLKYIRRNHPIHVHGFSPSEVDFWSTLYRMDARTVIQELVKAGLDSIPGGGGEILVQRVRDNVAKKKAGADRWLEVMEIAHQEGLKTSCTMMYGIGETDAERVEHLLRLKEVQKRTGGFTAFICWPLQPENTPTMSHMPKTDAVTYLRTTAFARTVLDNIPNIQASWVTMGMKVGQTALHYGCNDFGSLMLEENVVSAANTTHRTSIEEMERLITEAGFTPRRRRQDYQLLDVAASAAAGFSPPPPRRRRDAAAGGGSPVTAPFRVGIGYDSHRFAAGHGVLLGGVLIPASVRCTGHSDADAACHALTDAILGASGIGDIGEMFPDTKAENAGRNSIEMLTLAVARVKAAGYRPVQADITVICESPKIGPHRPAIRERLAAAIGVGPDDVMIKGKTNEGMGWIGRGEGIACIAVATLAPVANG